jgi:DNA transposition AAA+ family ATPase
MRDKIVQILLVRKLVLAARTLVDRPPGTPGIGLVSGAVGLGKSTATRHVCLTEDAVWVEAKPDWRPNWMYGDIAVELGAPRDRIVQKNFQRIIGALRQHPRAIFIDEADHLTTNLRLVESLRAIHDAASVPLILVGMEALPIAVRNLPQVSSRVAHWLEAAPCDLRDTRLMCEELCEVEIADDLVREIQERTRGIARGICVALMRLERHARRQGKRVLHLADVPEKFEFVYDHAAEKGKRRADPEGEQQVQIAAA